jgi:rhodanese-related sulfurtransferase
VFDPRLPSVAPGEIPPGATLLDVREDDEWAAGHAPGAVHLPMSQLAARLDEVPAGPVAVVCKVGGRSAQVTAFLVQRGHEAFNVSGGMLTWEAEGRPMTAEGPGPARVV